MGQFYSGQITKKWVSFKPALTCWDTANASKHFQWSNASGVSAIEDDPKIKDWYQYFFTSTAPGLFIEYAGEYYSIEQIKEIAVQFYSGLLSHVE
ncbi:hypothetical protein SAMN05216299_1395 [Nitrosospira sp. Nsp14]|uniref:hypothetical protein n=1 Tax=Nitrosospira sp. Nsp14 TaxID=1855333 RepID=UPI0008E00A1B|nr:hypothetical protein [Nitrosospira sp. Nsp14]SFH61929.1 hypothetical protein SAMN05216299_1395 [Nitrosospira sp. Nsp14]